jgi:hypothetical protein
VIANHAAYENLQCNTGDKFDRLIKGDHLNFKVQIQLLTLFISPLAWKRKPSKSALLKHKDHGEVKGGAWFEK